MKEKIDQVMVFQDDAGEWWLEFYANDIRHQVTIEDVMNGLASFVNMQVANAALHERINDLESRPTKDAPDRLWRTQEYDTGHPDPMFIVKESRTNGGG